MKSPTAVRIACAVPLLLFVSSAFAVPIFVNKNAPGPAHDGASWQTAFTTVTGGINAATAGRELWVAAAQYNERITIPNGVALYGGFAGVETVRDARNPVANLTILDGGTQGVVVKFASSAGASTRIEGFVIRNGRAEWGGGIQCVNASPTIANNVITGNTSIGAGGGIYCSGAAPTIIGNAITANFASSLYGDGGGICCDENSNATIVSNAIKGNIANQNGGGIAGWNSSPIISNNVIANNLAFLSEDEFDAGRGSSRTSIGGGGILLSERAIEDYFQVMNGRCNAVVVNNIIAANGGFFINGGACVYEADASTPLFANNTIACNNGAGFWWQNSAVSLVNNIIAFNSLGVNGDPKVGNPPAILRNNCVHGNGLPGARPANYQDMLDQTGLNGNIASDPVFVSAMYGDFHIQPWSACVNAGYQTVVQPAWTDIDGQARTSGGRVDIGADENTGVTGAPAPLIVRVATNGSDANSGASWAAPKKTVQAAINTAAIVGGEVWVKAGTYNERINIPPFVHVRGGFAGSETSSGAANPKVNVTILDGQQGGSVVVMSNGYLVTRLSGFTVRNGKMDSGGGGVLCLVGGPVIEYNDITGNTAQYGGGINVYCGVPYIAGNTVRDNTQVINGGGLYAKWSTPVVYRNTFSGNVSAGQQGGGMFVEFGGLMAVENVIENNLGGGLYAKDATVGVARNTVRNNNSQGDNGGGMKFTFCAGTVSNNDILQNSTQYGLSAGMGGGIAVFGAPEGTTHLMISNNTIAGNYASFGMDFGGGIGYYLQSPGRLTISNNILAYNSGGIYQVYQNPPGPSAALYRNALYQNVSQDLFGNWVDQPYINRSPGATDMQGVDPAFVSLTIPDTHLQATSLMINAGNDAYVTAGDLDRDGKARIIGTHVDIGAYEYGTPPAFTAADVRKALRIGAGLEKPTQADVMRLNVANTGTSFGRVDVVDAAGIARKIAGLDTNP